VTIKSDRWIQAMARERGMIEPFVAEQVRGGIISYGLSSYGYDMRVADEFKVFTNVFNTLVDPKHFDPRSFVDVRGDYCDIPPNSFALARSVEYFRIPRNVLCIVLGKSTIERRCRRGSTPMRGSLRCCFWRATSRRSCRMPTKRANTRTRRGLCRRGCSNFPYEQDDDCDGINATARAMM
jgi:hypothetical protein